MCGLRLTAYGRKISGTVTTHSAAMRRAISLLVSSTLYAVFALLSSCESSSACCWVSLSLINCFVVRQILHVVRSDLMKIWGPSSAMSSHLTIEMLLMSSFD